MKFLILFLSVFLFAQKLIYPIPENVPFNKQKAKLGEKLFFDTILSSDKTISCASCHKPDEGWADKRPVSIGVEGKKGIIQSPTVLNSRFNFRQMWDGSCPDLKSQMNFPIHNPVEMNMTNELIEKRLNTSKEYKKLFKEIYHKDYITYDMAADAIAEFEKALYTPDCKFDLYLKGKAKLTKEEQKGFELFKTYGCIICHNGINVGGNSFQKMGVIHHLKDCVGDRYSLTHNPIDRCVYKVPTLRNIALTAPYFHNASAKTLFEAVKKMGYYNLGLEIPDSDVRAIVAFLKTLTGKTPSFLRGKDEKRN